MRIRDFFISPAPDTSPYERRSQYPALPIETQMEQVVWDETFGDAGAESIPAIYRAVDIIAGSISRLAARNETGLSRRPDPFMTREAFWYETVHSLATTGDFYWMLSEAGGSVNDVRVLDPSDVTVTLEHGARHRDYTWLGNPVPVRLIRHGRIYPRTGQERGMSPLQAASTTWASAVNGERWGADLFTRSGIPPGVLESDYDIDPDEADEVSDRWDDAQYLTRRTPVVPLGLKYKPIQLSPVDMQYLAFKNATATDVARIYGIPSALLEVALEGQNLTYENLAEVGSDLVRWCLDRYLTVLAETWDMIPGQPVLDFDTTPLFRQSAFKRSQTMMNLTQAGADTASAATTAGFSNLDVTPSDTDSEPERAPL